MHPPSARLDPDRRFPWRTTMSPLWRILDGIRTIDIETGPRSGILPAWMHPSQVKRELEDRKSTYIVHLRSIDTSSGFHHQPPIEAQGKVGTSPREKGSNEPGIWDRNDSERRQTDSNRKETRKPSLVRIGTRKIERITCDGTVIPSWTILPDDYQLGSTLLESAWNRHHKRNRQPFRTT